MKLDKSKTVEYINELASFCGKKDIKVLDSKSLVEKYNIKKVDVMVLFGGSILYGCDQFAQAIKDGLAKSYVIVGGQGHTTDRLRNHIRKYLGYYPSDVSEAEMLNEYLENVHGVKADFLETKSTNCGNNITYFLELMKEQIKDVTSILFIQDRAMQRRMDAGFQKYIDPSILLINYPAYEVQVIEKDHSFIFDEERNGMWSMDEYIALLLSEIPRLSDDEEGYGPKGSNFIAHVDIPDSIKKAYTYLIKLYPNTIRKAQ